MKQLNEQQLQVHVPIVAWLLIAHSLLNMVLGLFAFALIMSGNVLWGELGQLVPAVNDPDALRTFQMFTTLTTLTAILIGTLVVGLAMPALAAGIGLLLRKRWGRVLAIVAAVLGLAGIPIGTLIGIYAIFVLMQDATTDYFASLPARSQPTPQPA
jgi:hypothetical protein